MSTLEDAISRVRDAESKLAELDPKPFPVPVTGLEALVAGTVTALDRSDWWVPGLRERAGAVLRGVSIERLVDGLAGARPYRVAPPSPSPSMRALTAVGLAVATEGIAAVHLGVGSVSDGAFHEALNLAALTGAKVIFIVAVHQLDDGAPVGPQTAASPSALATAYGIGCTVIPQVTAQAVNDAVRSARDATGPHLLQIAI